MIETNSCILHYSYIKYEKIMLNAQFHLLISMSLDGSIDELPHVYRPTSEFVFTSSSAPSLVFIIDCFTMYTTYMCEKSRSRSSY